MSKDSEGIKARERKNRNLLYASIKVDLWVEDLYKLSRTNVWN